MLKKLFGRRPGRALEPAPPEALPLPKPYRPSVDAAKVRVLFLCFGNSCRSPMAEGLAAKYGSDVMTAESAGLSPIHRVDPLGIKVMKDRNIDISSAFPKSPDEVNAQSFDLIVNMSGQRLPALRVPIEEWNIPDPIGQDEEAFRKTADLLEQQVMRLVLQLRLNQHPMLKRS
jgi:protein-tyrosine-phosphatase